MICVRCGKALKAFTAVVTTKDGRRGWGPKCAKMAGLIQQFMDSPPAQFRQSAEDYARYVTFQQPLGEMAAAAQKFFEWNAKL